MRFILNIDIDNRLVPMADMPEMVCQMLADVCGKIDREGGLHNATSIMKDGDKEVGGWLMAHSTDQGNHFVPLEDPSCGEDRHFTDAGGRESGPLH